MLPYPFVPPRSSAADFSIESYAKEKRAAEGRCAVTYLKKSYDNTKDVFPFSATDLAHMILYMANNFDDFEPYKPVINEDDSDQEDVE